MPSRMPPTKPTRPTTALRSPPAMRSTMRSGQPKNISAHHHKKAQHKAGHRRGAPLRPEFLARHGHNQRAQYQTDDLRPDILHYGRLMHPHAAGDIPHKAGDAKAHVLGVSGQYQPHGNGSHNQPCENHPQRFFVFHVFLPLCNKISGQRRLFCLFCPLRPFPYRFYDIFPQKYNTSCR